MSIVRINCTSNNIKWSHFSMWMSSVILGDRFGPEILTMLEISTSFACVHIWKFRVGYQKNSLLTRKLPIFLSRLNETSGGNGNITLFSGSLRRILKFLRMIFWLPGLVYGRRSWMELCWFLRPVKFLGRFLDQFFGHDVCRCGADSRQSQGSRVFWKTGTFRRAACSV